MPINNCSKCGSGALVVNDGHEWYGKCEKCKNKSATCNYSLLAIEEWNIENGDFRKNTNENIGENTEDTARI